MAFLQRMRCRPVLTSAHSVMLHRHHLSHRMNSSCTGPLFPYGKTDFASIRERNQFFVDNSRFIKELEQQAESNILLRPPRFGKSLFANMLARYYDVNTTQEQFERWFGGLDIFEHAKSAEGLKLARQYHVLELDFSIDVVPAHGQDRMTAIHENLRARIYAKLTRFASKYGLSADIREANFAYSLEKVTEAIHSRGGRLYVIVDEYDRFANKLMLDADLGAYESIVAGKSGQALSSPIRSFFETLKMLAEDGTFRSYTTGIAPIALADASGANHMWSLTHEPDFADVCGFKRADVETALAHVDLRPHDVKFALNLMEKYYDGYRFDGSTEPLYNPALCLFFLTRLAKNPSYFLEELRGPRRMKRMSDRNVNVSESVVGLVQRAPGGCEAVLAARSGEPLDVDLWDDFRLREFLSPAEGESSSTDASQAATMMYHHGLLTYSATRKLVVPNLIAKHRLLHQACSVRIPLRAVEEAVLHPTERRWRRLIEDIFVLGNSVATLCDNNCNEAALQSALCSAIGQLTRGIGNASHESELKVKVKVLENENENENKKTSEDGYADILVQTGGSGVLLELKRLRPRQIEFKSERIMEKRDKKVRFVAEEISEELGGMSEEELCEVKLRYVSKSGMRTVGDVLDSACKQAAKYAALKESHRLDRLHGFGVVSVATRIIVRDAELNV
eukprot:TRINITY_DN50_c0_g1_i12.p1 TRINITY_DN50_c0_g1~~TRINITY_DN50_c0_g1_i12.p1  ORF type:complete len:679 (-),score=107.73 TRINITY_DN50_c0_g1_i12:186-2222(-)